MKKGYLTIFLFVSLFFFYSSNVKADVVTYEVNESEFDYFTDEFYQLRDFAIEYANENNKYYVIYYENALILHFFSKSSNQDVYYNNGNGIRAYFRGGNEYYKIIDGVIKSSGSLTSHYSYLIPDSNPVLTYLGYLDSNIENLPYSSGSSFNISYKGLLYEITVGTHVPSLYEIYLDYTDVPDIHAEEKEVLFNFYNLIIEKINILTTSFASNYIYLFIFGIMIFIFVFELIRRYFL